jgi:rhodanese-related sulfurtransferase/polyisoprenoid-binding protein YceI
MDTSQYREMDTEETVWFIEKKDGVVVDVLPPEHFATRHIPGAESACAYEVGFLDQIKELAEAKDTAILLYGAGLGSLDSVAGAEKLLRAGYGRVMVYLGGLKAWEEAGLDLEGDTPDQDDPPHPVLNLEKKSYTLIPEESVLTWRGRNDNGSHYGTLSLKSGELVHTDHGRIEGWCVLDMTSIRCVDLEGDALGPVLESHLMSDDFFFASLFPTARFILKTGSPMQGTPATLPNYAVFGALELRGIRREMDFQAHLRNLTEGKLVLTTNLDFDRTDWGVLYGSARFFKYLGYHRVYDTISVEFRLVLG